MYCDHEYRIPKQALHPCLLREGGRGTMAGVLSQVIASPDPHSTTVPLGERR
jgi:hypothetical protein